MKISAKTEYACLAMFELAAAHGSDEPVRIGHIADRHGIPARFLVQILLQLKAAGLVASTRGAAGGYRLLRSPSEVTLADVMNIIEGNDETIATSATVDSAVSRVLVMCWQEAAQAQRDLLASVTLQDLTQRARRQVENMYYI